MIGFPGDSRQQSGRSIDMQGEVQQLDREEKYDWCR